MTLREFTLMRHQEVIDGLAKAGKDDFHDTLRELNYSLPSDVPTLTPKDLYDILIDYGRYINGRYIKGHKK